MKNRIAACFLVVGFLAAIHPEGRTGIGEDDPLILKARAMVDALSREDFKASVRDFDETMLKLSGPDKMAALWKQISGQLGAFQRRSGDRRDKLGHYDIVLVTCVFEKQTFDFRVVFNPDGRIGGLQTVPTAPPAVYAPPDYSDREKLTEAEVTVGGEPWALPGTLTMPKGKGPFPALVLVHGSGPNDRDETLGPNKTFKDLAWGLASRGIAVLRYDKRTFVHGKKMIADPGYPLMTVKEETIDDAVAAVRLLQATPGLDPRRIFILGHSLGGGLLPRIAAAADRLDPAGLIFLAGWNFPMEDEILRQTTYLLSLDGLQSDDDKKRLNDLRTEVEAIKAFKESDRGSRELRLGASAAYWLDLRGYDPLAEVSQVKKPMLFLQGQRDYQVLAVNLGRWKTALEGRNDVFFKLYPGLNHLFLEGQGIPTPNEYTLTHKSVSRDVIDDIETFIRAGRPGQS
ncbi:MAG: alpha/beta fold hydrolase [Candidatus Aminicenantes bacterium]|nr:alpha/beta fold hydrolase [Candidatus Aminicenantes bacterium]